MTNTRKVLLSILLLLVALSCFIYAPPLEKTTRTKTVTISSQEQSTETIEIQNPGIAKFLEWIGIGALILAAWFWRKELGVTQLGPLGGAVPVTQQPAGTPLKSPEESGPPPILDLATISKEMANNAMQQRLEQIMQMFQKTHSINVSYVAKELGVASNTAKTLLFFLKKTDQLRADGFPRNTIYTPSKSIENRILDTAREKLSNTYGILSERRFIRVKRMYEIDSLLESAELTFIVEAKILRINNLLSRLDEWTLRLMNVAKEFQGKKVICVLAIGCLEGIRVDDVKKQVASFTFDTGATPLQILVFSESELV
jgi:hypothetical protein